MGAATALLTLKYETPDFVIADCPFADSKLLFAQWLKRNLHIPIGMIWPILRRRAKRKYDYDVESVCPIAAVQGKNVPICLMHGKSDNLIPYTHSEMLHKACVNPNSELHLSRMQTTPGLSLWRGRSMKGWFLLSCTTAGCMGRKINNNRKLPGI